MPEKETMARVRRDRSQGKAPSTQAGEFIREEIHHIREGRHGARSTKQAIAIGLSKARRAGVDLPPPEPGRVTEATRRSAQRAYEQGQGGHQTKHRPRVSRAVRAVLQHEGHGAASYKALAMQARSSARGRSAAERSDAARKAVRTKGPSRRAAAARKAARTRARDR